MNQRIEKIRQLLSELEAAPGEQAAGDLSFSAFELPEVIQQIVDDLQPLLTPYDAAFYWFLFRHSIAKDGSPTVRVSTRSLQRAVVRSSYSQAEENTISLGKVQESLRALEDIGAIRKEGQPNRQGTQYRVLLPAEIPASRKFRAERLVAEPTLMFPAAKNDGASDHVRRIRAFERDEYKCRRCQKALTRFTASLDYVIPISEGGDDSSENLLTVCGDCHSLKGGRSAESIATPE
jgi:hypothetical protein